MILLYTLGDTVTYQMNTFPKHLNIADEFFILLELIVKAQHHIIRIYFFLGKLFLR